MPRKPIVGISMKIYQNKIHPAINYAKQISELEKNEKNVEEFLLPSIGVIYPVAQTLKLNHSTIGYGAQNIAPVANGAYTGEYSIESLLDIHGRYVEIGHAERRNIFKESDSMINRKIKLTYKNDLVPILCVGEKKKMKKADLEKYFGKILSKDLQNINPSFINSLIIAYEPFWAIGQRQAAEPQYVHLVLHVLRKKLKELYKEHAEKARFIYGGSVSKETVSKIINYPDIDGVFVGRFGHNPQNYHKIVQIVKQIKLSNLQGEE